ncbi:hypothetical protein ACH44C_00970 [Streptomyces purpureus]
MNVKTFAITSLIVLAGPGADSMGAADAQGTAATAEPAPLGVAVQYDFG